MPDVNVSPAPIVLFRVIIHKFQINHLQNSLNDLKILFRISRTVLILEAR